MIQSTIFVGLILFTKVVWNFEIIKRFILFKDFDLILRNFHTVENDVTKFLWTFSKFRSLISKKTY